MGLAGRYEKLAGRNFFQQCRNIHNKMPSVGRYEKWAGSIFFYSAEKLQFLLFCTPISFCNAIMKKCLILKSVKSNSRIHKSISFAARLQPLTTFKSVSLNELHLVTHTNMLEKRIESHRMFQSLFVASWTITYSTCNCFPLPSGSGWHTELKTKNEINTYVQSFLESRKNVNEHVFTRGKNKA